MPYLSLIITFPTGVICSEGPAVFDTVEAFKSSQCKTQRANKGRKNTDKVIFPAANICSVVSWEKKLCLLTLTAELFLADSACLLQTYPLWNKSSRDWAGTSPGQFHTKEQVGSPAGGLSEKKSPKQSFKAVIEEIHGSITLQANKKQDRE